MNSDSSRSFTALHIVSTIFSGLAWAALAIIPCVLAAIAYHSPTGIPTVAAFLLGIIPGGLCWLVLMFSAQSITVLLAIEENTRKAVKTIAGVALFAALASPAYAGPACDLQKNMTENLCAKAFKLVLGRPLEDKSTPVKMAENTFGFGVCLLAGKGAVEDCNNGKVVNARFSCNEFADMLQENIDFGCQTMAEKSDSLPEIKNALKPISKDHRDLLCRKVWLRAEQLVLKECGR